MTDDRRKRSRTVGFPDLFALFPSIFLSPPTMAQAFPAFGLAGPPASPAAPAPPSAPRSQGPRTESDDQVYTDPSATRERGSTAPLAVGRSSYLGEKALAVAKREIGVAEDPPASNRGGRVDQYQRGSAGQPWCAHFVSWCVGEAGQSPFGHVASVTALRNWAKGRGKYLPAQQQAPLAGDIFTMPRYDRTGKLVGGHTGFVVGYDPKSQRVRTVEGNAGDRVKEGSYALSVLDGFIRL